MTSLKLSGKPSKHDSAVISNTAERTLRVLEKACDSGRLAHALLFHGDSLRELENVACALAARLLNSTGEKILHHPDLFVLRPINKMRQINVESVRELIRRVHHSPQQGLRKVALIYEVDRMNAAASNAFLKTLEEPPSDTTLLLLTTRLNSISNTLRSRCLHFFIPCDFACVDDEAWRQWQNHYKSWLDRLCARPSNATARADLLLGLYGLATQFERCLKHLLKDYWKTYSEMLSPPSVDSVERDALEAGAYKGLRRQLFLEIEQCTQDFARQKFKQGGLYPTAAFTQSIKELEHCVRLLEVNLNETAALEYFLLQSLRNWTR